MTNYIARAKCITHSCKNCNNGQRKYCLTAGTIEPEEYKTLLTETFGEDYI